VAACGLQLYRFGQCVSICFFTPTWRPDSFYDRVASNRKEGLHTLCLLDIRVKEPTEESLCRQAAGALLRVWAARETLTLRLCLLALLRRGRKVYEPPRYMTAQLAAEQLLEVEANRGTGGACTTLPRCALRFRTRTSLTLCPLTYPITQCTRPRRCASRLRA
jgi:diphthine synthase